MRRFELHRTKDVTGVSGTGVVAQGVEFDDGTVALRWLGDKPSVVFHDSGMDSVETIHGHSGSTVVVFLNDDLAQAALADAWDEGYLAGHGQYSPAEHTNGSGT